MYKNIIKNIELLQTRNDLKNVNVGNVVKIKFYIDKNNKRFQIFSGIIIAKKNNRSLSYIIVRKISYGVGVEKTFFINSPNIIDITICKKKKVRKSKLYFIRKNNKKFI